MLTPEVIQQLQAAETLKNSGQIGEALAYYRSAVALDPDNPEVHSGLLFAMHYDPSVTPGQLLLEHEAYGARFPICDFTGSINRDHDRRLRIGYVSADFHQHPVGLLMMPVLAAHDCDKFRIFCYHNYNLEDGITAFCKSKTHHWREIIGVSHADVAQLVRDDKIDILVDLGGHSGRNRLPVFAQKPAPVQVTYAGYFGTTGLPAIDYLITDRFLTPPSDDRYIVEKPVRLPNGYCCYAMPGHAPPVGPLPAKIPGEVTFGSFNSMLKINPKVIALWAKILRELPKSRLLLKARMATNPIIKNRIHALFDCEEIAADRVILEDGSPHPEYLARYNDVDIALDPFPFSGGCTTLDALWMGVPVVTMPGETFASRHSLSYLSVVDLGDYAAPDQESYVGLATMLAGRLDMLHWFRAHLRDAVNTSPIRRTVDFTRNLENAYRQMWRECV